MNNISNSKLGNFIKRFSKLPHERDVQETEFLPAILEVTDKPPSVYGRVVMWSVIVLVAVGLLWSIFGHVDEVAIAEGKVIPVGNVQTIQAESKGTIKKIYVKEGQFVHAGDSLIDLDETVTSANIVSLKEQVDAYKLTRRRLEAAKAGISFYSNDPNIDDEDEAIQMRLAASQENEYQTRLAVAGSAVYEAESAIAKANIELINLRGQYEIAADKEARMEKLLEQNAVAYFTLLDYRGRRMELEQLVKEQEKEVDRQAEVVAGSRRSMENIVAARQKEIDSEINDVSVKLTQAEEELKKANNRDRYISIKTPIDGYVNQLMVYTNGGVVTEAQQLMTIVPADAELEIEAWITNKDIGYIYTGQPAEIKVETFNFQKYGLLDAVVDEISPDVIDRDEKNINKNLTNQPKYRVMLKLLQDNITVGDKKVRLSTGMNVQAEVKIKQKRIIEYFLDPFRKYQSEALRER